MSYIGMNVPQEKVSILVLIFEKNFRTLSYIVPTEPVADNLYVLHGSSFDGFSSRIN